MKKNRARIIQMALLTLVLSICATSCNAPKSEEKKTFDLAQAKIEIEAANQIFMDDLSKGDSVGVANCYASNAKFMPPNSPAAIGKPGIQSVVAALINSGATKIDLKVADVWGTEDLITEEGTYTLATSDGTQLDKGKYLVLWKKEDGKWKLFRDIFNSDIPVPAAN